AVLQRDRPGHLVAPLLQLAGNFSQIVATRLGGEFAPTWKSRVRIGHGLSHHLAISRANLGKRFRRGRVYDAQRGLGAHPPAVEIKRGGLHCLGTFFQSFRNISMPRSVNGWW